MTRAEARALVARLDRDLIATDWRAECTQVDGAWRVRVVWPLRGRGASPAATIALRRVLEARRLSLDEATRLVTPW